MLGLLALLAVAGAFVLGLLSYLRLSERVAESRDGEDNRRRTSTAGSRCVNQRGVVLYRNRALQRLTGRRAGRQATLQELFAGSRIRRPSSGSIARPSEAKRATRSSTFAPAQAADAKAHGCGSVCGRFLAPGRTGVEGQRLTLWQVADVTRERTREIETGGAGWSRRWPLYDSLPQGLPRRGSGGPGRSQASSAQTLVAMAAPQRTESGRRRRPRRRAGPTAPT
mgnify:CR=1 FL=1